MPTKDKHEHGQFSWAELATTDSAGAKRFYGGLFGWTFDDQPAGPGMVYTMNRLGAHLVSALFEPHAATAAQGAPPHWLSYVTVDDADATAAKAKAAGGKVSKEPFDVFDVGRMAVLEDPTGAKLAIWQPKKHAGAGIVNEPGALCWNELFTDNVDAAGKFYVQTFGWRSESVDMGPMGTYTLFSKDGSKGTNRAGMMPMPPNMKGAPPSWLVYFAASDCDASAKKVEGLGGKVLAPPTDIPGNIGRFAVVSDPQGAVFALFQSMHG
jgi:predicted enzyme related to lactoylglutathione lyase